MRLSTLAVVALALAVPCPAMSQPAPSAGPRLSAEWRTLVGQWDGVGGGEPGSGTGTSTFVFDLGGQVLMRRSHSVYPAADGRPATVHDDVVFIYPTSAGGAAKAVYADNEGHVIEYAAAWSADGNVLTFLSEAKAAEPRYRLVYTRTGPEEMTVAFDVAPPGKPDAFTTYVSGRIRRESPRPPRS